MYINKVILVGNLTRDPELKSTPSGTQVCSISMATNRVYKDKNDQKQEEVQFHNLTAWGKTAELIARYMRKGNQMYVEGRLETRSWEDKNGGGKRYTTEIIVESMQFGNNKREGDERAPRSQQSVDRRMDEVAGGNQSYDTIEYPDDEDINPDDIPF